MLHAPVREPARVVLAAHWGRVARCVEGLLGGEAGLGVAAWTEVPHTVNVLRRAGSYARGEGRRGEGRGERHTKGSEQSRGARLAAETGVANI